jgi:hypothetical protein
MSLRFNMRLKGRNACIASFILFSMEQPDAR